MKVKDGIYLSSMSEHYMNLNQNISYMKTIIEFHWKSRMQFLML